MSRQIRPPESILEELNDTAYRWMNTRAEERAVGPQSEVGRGDLFPHDDDLERQDVVAEAAGELKRRFEELTEEFIERLDEP